MEALFFIKRYHKKYIGDINKYIIDDKGNNYEYYKNLYCNKLNKYLECNKTMFKYKENEYIGNIIYYFPYINEKIYNYNIIHLMGLINTVIFNYYCNNICDINMPNSNIILNITLPLLENINCNNIIINAIQPKIIYLKLNQCFKCNLNIIKNLNDLLIKLPNLKYINFDNIIMKYENNYWNLMCKYNFINKLHDIDNLNINIKQKENKKLEIYNIKNLIINININNLKLSDKCKILKLYNIDNLTINSKYKYKIIINKNYFKMIKINKFINCIDIQFKINDKKYNINIINLFYYINNKKKYNNDIEFLFDFINNIKDINKLMNLSTFIIDNNIKINYLSIFKHKNNLLMNIKNFINIYYSYFNLNLENTIKFYNKLKKLNYEFNEDNNFFIFNKK